MVLFLCVLQWKQCAPQVIATGCSARSHELPCSWSGLGNALSFSCSFNPSPGTFLLHCSAPPLGWPSSLAFWPPLADLRTLLHGPSWDLWADWSLLAWITLHVTLRLLELLPGHTLERFTVPVSSKLKWLPSISGSPSSPQASCFCFKPAFGFSYVWAVFSAGRGEGRKGWTEGTVQSICILLAFWMFSSDFWA